MHYELICSFAQASAPCWVLGFWEQGFENCAWEGSLQAPVIARLQAKLKEPGDIVWQAEAEGVSLLLLHCGNKESFSLATLEKYLQKVTHTLLQYKVEAALFAIPSALDVSPDKQVETLVEVLDFHCYQLSEFKTIQKKPPSLQRVQVIQPRATAEAIKRGLAVAEGVRLCRRLADLPANHCTPTLLGKEAEKLASQYTTIKTKVFDVHALQEMGMGGLLAIGQGSVEPPCFIELSYQGAGEKSPVVLVGKGITFDAGGLSLKPANLMDEMKYDMAGAATVLGVLQTCAALNLPINVVGLIASAENLPSGTAVKPGDIITSLSGQTIEIMNTDAEGRVVLADALTYAARFKPRCVIDIATLTGAIIVALGNVYAGLFTKDEALAQNLLQASSQSRDKIWRMPMDPAYDETIESPLADMINASFDRTASSIVAATFLSRFTKDYPWAHLDVAGSAWVTGKKRIATGRPLPLLIQFLQNESEKS